MTAYRADLPPRPARMMHLPIDDRGFLVPWFVATVDGKPDFRAIRPSGIAEAWNKKTCWLCGGPMGVYKACVVGPMCGVNRITSEPPCHLECAEYAAKACPFLTRPLAVRNERGMPEGSMAGIGIKRNPGATLVWVTKDMQPFKVSKGQGGGWLFKLGDPVTLQFWARGRRATRAEVQESVDTGLPILREYAERDGAGAVAQLEAMIKVFEALLPSPNFVPKE